MLGLAVAVGMPPIRGPNRHADGEERQERSDEVGAGVDGLRHEPEAAAREAGGQLEANEGAGCAHGDERGSPLWRHVAKPRESPPPILTP